MKGRTGQIVLGILSVCLVPIGSWLLLSGSLELYPTEEQIEKSRIVGVVLLVTGILLGLIAGIWYKKV